MKICVLIKQVPDADSQISIADDHLSIVEDGITFATNECDAYALEEALLLKEAHKGEVVVCTLGKESALQVVKDGLAKGADRGIFLSDTKFENLTALQLAKTIHAAIKDENFDLILTGLQSDDMGNSQVGVLLAELLNVAHCSLVIGTELLNESTLKTKKELEGGWFRSVEVDLPAVLSIQSGINKPRYASLRGIMMMKRKPIKTLTAADIDAGDLSTGLELKKLYVPKKTKETTFIEGSPEEIVEKLIDKLENEIQAI